jgi:hypothetical protein
MKELVEIISVIAVQSVLGTNPDKTGLVLGNGMETVIGHLADGISVRSLRMDLNQEHAGKQGNYRFTHCKSVIIGKYNPLFMVLD